MVNLRKTIEVAKVKSHCSLKKTNRGSDNQPVCHAIFLIASK